YPPRLSYSLFHYTTLFLSYPLFALRTGDTRTITYESGNKRIIIRPLADLGRATILDKDIWIFIISRLMQAKDFKNLKISKTVERSEEHTSELESRFDIVCR